MLFRSSTQSEWESNAYALQNTPGLTIRKDLYEELGSPAINNFNDLENLLLAAKEAYPNMVPIHLNANWKFSYFESMFGVGGSQGWDGFYDDGNGGVSYWLRNPKYLDLLRLINNYYKKGLIDTKNFAFNSQEDDAQNPMLADKCFAMTFNAQIGDRTNGDFEKLGRDTRVFMVENLLSEDAKFFSNGVGWSGVFITKKNQHLKESINFMKYMFSEEGQRLGLWGIENEDWTLDPEGYPKFNYPTQDNTVMLEKGVFWWGLLSGSAVNEGLKNYDPTLMGTKVMQNAKPRFSYNPAIGLLNPAADTPEAVIKTKVSEMIKNEITKIVMAKSDEDLQAAYADVISKAETIGLKQYEEWANATYKSALKSME